MGSLIIPLSNEGACSFRLGYLDRTLSVPSIETFFFLGKGIFGTLDDSWFFQHAERYLEQAAASTVEDFEKVGIIKLSSDDLVDIVDWYGLISELAENKR